MFIPIHDDNRLKSIEFQYVTLALIATNIAVYFLFPNGTEQGIIASFGVVPDELAASVSLALPTAPGTGTLAVPESYTLLSYMFFHADILHLAGNMVFLWVFGDNVEDAVGHLKFLLFYLLCGAFAAITHTAIVMNTAVPPETGIPLIGASGAVAGVVAAYLLLHPKVRVWILVLPFFPARVSAALALGAWILFQIFMILRAPDGQVAWWAHVGGLLAGAALIVVMRRRGVKLFE